MKNKKNELVVNEDFINSFNDSLKKLNYFGLFSFHFQNFIRIIANNKRLRVITITMLKHLLDCLSSDSYTSSVEKLSSLKISDLFSDDDINDFYLLKFNDDGSDDK